MKTRTVMQCEEDSSIQGHPKNNARIIKNYNSKTVKHTDMIQVLKC
jgi:hypothetical protein